MLTVACILWVLNMALAASTSNRAWALNAFAALVLTIDIANMGI